MMITNIMMIITNMMITIQEEDRDSPVAFTINFGGGEENYDENDDDKMITMAIKMTMIIVMTLEVGRRALRRRTRGWRGDPRTLCHLLDHHHHHVQVCFEEQPKEAAISAT